MDQLTQVQDHLHAAQVIPIEDDIRALQHYLDFGYFQHPKTRDAVRRLLESLKEELSTIEGKDAS